MSDRSQLNQWFLDNGHSLPSYHSKLSDRELYEEASRLYSHSKSYEMKAGANHAEHHDKRMLYLVPHEESDGSVYYVDRNTGSVMMSMTRQPNGLFSYYGPKEMEMFFGRGNLDQMNKNVSDGKYFADVAKK